MIIKMKCRELAGASLGAVMFAALFAWAGRGTWMEYDHFIIRYIAVVMWVGAFWFSCLALICVQQVIIRLQRFRRLARKAGER